MARESVGLISVAHQAFVTIAGCGVNALSGLRVAREFVGLISVAHQAFVTIAGCGVNALSGLRMAQESVGLIKRSASGICHHCRMRRERLIRPTNGTKICRPDKRSASGSLALVITPSPSVADITT
ncbi:hypothetical protein JZM19_11095 [Escherichia coli]|nr:hypothetical protein [Escherichia coli]